MKLTVRETAIFAMLGAVMYASKIIMDLAPNIHLIGVFVMATTVVYRKKALYPIYIFVVMTGLLNGFSAWMVMVLSSFFTRSSTMITASQFSGMGSPVSSTMYCS